MATDGPRNHSTLAGLGECAVIDRLVGPRQPPAVLLPR